MIIVGLGLVLASSCDRSYAQESSGEPLTPSPRDSLQNIRGVEIEKRGRFELWAHGVNTLLFIPRTALDGLFYTAGWSLNTFNDPDFQEKFERFFYFYENRFGWTPLFNLDGDWNPEIGAALFFRENAVKVSLDGKYTRHRKWRLRFRLRNPYKTEQAGLRTAFITQMSEADDMIFYGFGNDPEQDSRNSFRDYQDEEYGVYFQRRKQAQLVFDYHTGSPWSFKFSGFVQEREITSSRSDDEQLINVFDISTVTGYNEIQQSVYTEFALTYDTQQFDVYRPEYDRFEFFGGVQEGINNRVRFVRLGCDLSKSLVVYRHNRVLVPRLVVNTIDKLPESEPIPFYDYPRHPTFRGVSLRRLLRADRYQFVPSLEYRWPLTHLLQGYLFTDGLIVAEELDEIDWKKIPWVIGFGIEFLSSDELQAGAFVGGGSEGIRATLYLGDKPYQNSRSEWR